MLRLLVCGGVAPCCRGGRAANCTCTSLIGDRAANRWGGRGLGRGRGPAAALVVARHAIDVEELCLGLSSRLVGLGKELLDAIKSPRGPCQRIV